MDEHDFLAEQFEENRTHLRAVAYRMLGSMSEADDAVQEAWLRLGRSDTSEVENLGGWLTTVVGRVCLDMLRSRRSRREEPLNLPRYAPGSLRWTSHGRCTSPGVRTARPWRRGQRASSPSDPLQSLQADVRGRWPHPRD